MALELDGIITFESSYQALRAERAALEAAIPSKLVPAPQDLSPTCVVALRFAWGSADRLAQLLGRLNIEIDLMRRYPEASGLPDNWNS